MSLPYVSAKMFNTETTLNPGVSLGKCVNAPETAPFPTLLLFHRMPAVCEPVRRRCRLTARGVRRGEHRRGRGCLLRIVHFVATGTDNRQAQDEERQDSGFHQARDRYERLVIRA